MRYQQKGLKLADIVVGESYTHRYDSAWRYEVLAIEVIEEPVHSSWRTPRKVRHVKVKIWDGDKVRDTRHIKANQLVDTWENAQARRRENESYKVFLNGARAQLQKAIDGTGVENVDVRPWARSIEIYLSPEAAIELAEAISARHDGDDGAG
jgi:hypothetical protein